MELLEGRRIRSKTKPYLRLTESRRGMLEFLLVPTFRNINDFNMCLSKIYCLVRSIQLLSFYLSILESIHKIIGFLIGFNLNIFLHRVDTCSNNLHPLIWSSGAKAKVFIFLLLSFKLEYCAALKSCFLLLFYQLNWIYFSY